MGKEKYIKRKKNIKDKKRENKTHRDREILQGLKHGYFHDTESA